MTPIEKKERITQLKNLIDNHRRLNAVDRSTYTEAMSELASLQGNGLSFEKSLEIILRAAKAGQYVTHKQLSDESGTDWEKVHWSVGPHLDQMLECCHRRGWPLLPAIVVQQDSLKDSNPVHGRLRGPSLIGFIKGCERLGIAIPAEHDVFADSEQGRVFAWAKGEVR